MCQNIFSQNEDTLLFEVWESLQNMPPTPLTHGWNLRPSCHLWATRQFTRKLSGRPRTRKACFWVTAAARSLCVPWTTKTTVVTQQVVQRRQSGGRTIAMVAQGLQSSPNGGTVVATVIAQWTLLVSQRRPKCGTGEAKSSLKLIHNVYNSTLFTGWPMIPVHLFCDLGGDVCAFLLWATYERPTCPATLCDCFEHAQKLHGDHDIHCDVWTSSVPPMIDQGNLSASLVPSTVTRPVCGRTRGGTKVAAPV